MSLDFIVDLVRQALEIIVILVAPLLGTALFVGILVSIFQAATQIREMTLSFIPKLVAVGAVLFILLPWMLRIVVKYTMDIFINIPYYIK